MTTHLRCWFLHADVLPGYRPAMTPWHLTLATDGRLPIAPTEDERRAIVRALVRLVESRGQALWLAQHYVAVQPLKQGREVPTA